MKQPYDRAYQWITYTTIVIVGTMIVSSSCLASDRPRIQVGLFTTTEPITVQVNSRSTAQTVTGEKIHSVSANTSVSLSYDSTTALYTVRTDTWSDTSATAIKIVPRGKNKISTITSYSHPPAWDTTLNDNQFYGTIMLARSVAGAETWVINDLGIENYVKGVGEGSNSSPTAFLKALYTAARSYAYYLYLHPTKHAGEPYLIDSTANDQIYVGYGLTARSLSIVDAVEITAGKIVTYNNEPVVTPYFSQSDGRTRSWSEVWGGDYPYLQSVVDPCCTSDELLGHGVGLSGQGAIYFANQGWHWQEILLYYYTGVELEKLW